MKKIILVLIVLLLFLGFTPYHELNNLAVVDVMGLELKNNKYILHLNVINDDNKIYTVKGDSLGEVFMKAKNVSNKKTYYKHLEVVIFNTDVLTNKKKIINFFKDEFTSIDYLVLSYNGDLSNLFNKYHKRNDYKSFIKKEKEESGSIINVTFKDFLSDSLDSTKTTNIPLIDVNNSLYSKGLYLPNINYIVPINLVRASYLLRGDINSYSEKIKINNNYYEVFLYDLRSSIKYKNNTLNIVINGNIDSPDSNHLDYVKEEVKKIILNDINSLIKSERSNKYNISNIINYIYLKERDDAFKYYKNSKVNIEINLDEERKNNYG